MPENIIPEHDAFGRDMSWITQEIVETYAAFCLRGEDYADREGLALCGQDKVKFSLLATHCNDFNQPFLRLKEQLLEKHGRDYFQPLMPSKELLRMTEKMMRRAARQNDASSYAEFVRFSHELRGWTERCPHCAGKLRWSNDFS
jgi:hypothetical protein